MARRRRVKLPERVAAIAAERGVPVDELLAGQAAAQRAGYSGPNAAKSLAQARRRGRVESFIPVTGSEAAWYTLEELDRFAAEGGALDSVDGPPAAAPWADGEPGEPVDRVEHELELEVVRLRERLTATEADRDRLAAELARAQSVAVALAGVVADSVAAPE